MYIKSELEIPIPPSHVADRNAQDDWDKMISDATFYFLVADQKKALIKVESCCTHCNVNALPFRPDAEG